MREEGLDGYDYYEGQPKWPLSRIIKCFCAIVSIIMYLIIFIRLFGACDNGFAESIILDQRDRRKIIDIDNLKVQRIYSETDEADDGRIQISYVTYIDECDNFQMTVKFNSKHHPKSKNANYKYILKKIGSEEREYTDHYSDSIGRIGYNYYRICFRDVEFDENDTLTIVILDENNETLLSSDVYSKIFFKRQITPDRISNLS